MGCGIPSDKLCKEFLIMNSMYDNIHTSKEISNIYKNLEFTEENPDFYVIISYAMPDDYHIPERTIVFQMEPWIYDQSKNWGIKCWPEQWRNPDKTKYLHVRTHKEYLNVAQFMFPMSKEINMVRHNKFIAIISEKLIDDGHINRVNFIKYVESMNYDIIDVYGSDRHNFRNYKGCLDSKYIQNDYKYVFSVENNREYNYATEKIWESFISYSLCFYDGCPNLNDYINNKSYVSIDCTKQEETLKSMLHAIDSDLWIQRLPYIKESNRKVINEYGFFPTVFNILNSV